MATSNNEQDKVVLVIHGGAGHLSGELINSDRQEQCKQALKEALERGLSVLKAGGASVDAVEQAIKSLEDCPLFNAGKGAVFNSAGEIELDAAIMDGRSKSAGAVCGIRTIKNPISAARAVMERTAHILFYGKGAEAVAMEAGLEIVDPEYFHTPARWQQHLNSSKPEAGQQPAERKFGTVGAVAVDNKGNLAAATSTGGTNMKAPGRVGDSPIIGAGTYADNATCAVSATGHGEHFMRYVVAYEMSALMRYKGYSVEQAAQEIINGRLKEAGGEGGLIAIDAKGNFASLFNTPGMYRGHITAGGACQVAIFKD